MQIRIISEEIPEMLLRMMHVIRMKSVKMKFWW